MKPREARIYNYKSICSEIAECNLVLDPRVTMLIGANESGKTNILEALAKFSTGEFEAEDLPYTSPAAQGQANSEDVIPIVSVVFELTEHDRSELGEIHPTLAQVGEVTITRNSDGSLSIELPDVETELSLDESLDQLGTRVTDLEVAFRSYTKEYRRLRKAGAGPTRSASFRMNSLRDRVSELDKDLLPGSVSKAGKTIDRLQQALKDLPSPIDSLQEQLLAPLDEIQVLIATLPRFVDASQVVELLEPRLPSFELVPAEPKLWLVGQYDVVELISGEGEGLTAPRRLLSLAGLDLESIRNLPSAVQIERLEQASRRVTRALRQIWHEGQDVEIHLDWSPEEGFRTLLITVVSSGHRGPPQHRSLGFRWFLEFYLLYATGKQGSRDTIFMLEEPGIHLHPQVQNDLKSLIREQVSEHNQVIFTTHLPGMYDPAYPESCRGVRKTSSDPAATVIETSYSADQQLMTWEVAMRALGETPETRLYPRNLLVEGAADWIYLLTFAQLLVGDHPELADLATGLVNIRPCGGTRGMKLQIPFYLQPGLTAVVVLDSDAAGRSLAEYLSNSLGLPDQHVTDVISISDIAAGGHEWSPGDHELEDFFDNDFFCRLVSDTLGSKGTIKPAELGSRNMIGAQAVALAESKFKEELRKDMVAWQFRASALKEGLGKVSPETTEHFLNLLRRVAGNFTN